MQKNDNSGTASAAHNRAPSVIVVNRKSLRRPSKDTEPISKKISVKISEAEPVEVTNDKLIEAIDNARPVEATKVTETEPTKTPSEAKPSKSTMKIDVEQHVDLESLENKIRQIQEKVNEAKKDPAKAKELSAKVKEAAKPKPKKSFKVAVSNKDKKAHKSEQKKNFSMAKVNHRMRVRSNRAAKPVPKKLSAKEMKDQAIKKALSSTNRYTPEKTERTRIHFGAKRILLALSCATVVVCAIVYFVNLNMPDMSLKVAAMQSGINATYPSYIPRGFNITNISSESGKISLSFSNAETGNSFTLDEENSSWDSNALLTNYVKKTFSNNFSSVRENGITVYIDDRKAAWVNGGILYKLEVTSGSLSKKQITSIAASH